MPEKNATAPLISMQGIHKRFPGVHALKGVDFSVSPGEIVALLGENGAGKSTLIKMLGGAHQPTEGTIRLDDEVVDFQTPQDSQKAGVAVIYQEFNLVPGLSIRENIFLGRERIKGWRIDHNLERTLAKKYLKQIGLDMDPETPCGELTVARQQAVEIARALSMDARLVVMDEPSAALSPSEVEQLFSIARDLQKQGIAIIYISHRLDEIYSICDRVVVLRDGANVGEGQVPDLKRNDLIEMMVGRPLESEFPKRKAKAGEEKLRVENLCMGTRVRNVSFSARAGEVLGFAGLVGAGRSETMRALIGADPKDSGTIYIDGKETAIHHPGEAIDQGICLLSEDRKSEGLVLIHSVVDNFGLPNLQRYSKHGRVDRNLERIEFEKYAKDLQIKISGPDQIAGNLSGGNQQKVVLAKWLARNTEVIIIDEPTRGIDVGAKYEIYQLINRLAAEGKAIIMVSSELPEILGMSDRIIVMHEGEVRGEITDMENATQEKILKMAIEAK
ncbi:MAG: sugar ABC transporter ATP-binding protein [Verrucomicrobiales bacterium]|nr:sugar ABC transporter ATP-binding protein [Verrucomicrobiales bacterium]